MEKEYRTERILIRVTPAEKKKLSSLANTYNRPMSYVVRSLLRGVFEEEQAAKQVEDVNV